MSCSRGAGVSPATQAARPQAEITRSPHQHKWGELGTGRDTEVQRVAAGAKYIPAGSTHASTPASLLAADFPNLSAIPAPSITAQVHPPGTVCYATAIAARTLFRSADGRAQAHDAHRSSTKQHNATSSSEAKQLQLVKQQQLNPDDLAFLRECYPWAGDEVVTAVLLSTNHNAREAAAALADMAAHDSDSVALEDHVTHEPSGSKSSSGRSYAERESRQQQRQDVYHQHRANALAMTRAWIKAVHRAAGAYRSGDHNSARQYAAEAARLRRAAKEAHQLAAVRIEADMNDTKTLWELDVHGLHVDEALMAVQRRLHLLTQQEKQWQPRVLLSQSAPSSPVHHRLCHSQALEPTAAGAECHDHSGKLLAAVATVTPVVALAPAAPQRGGACSHLRIVVGKGKHSSNGEASLPRVVAAHLEAEGYKFNARAGQIVVKLGVTPLHTLVAARFS